MAEHTWAGVVADFTPSPDGVEPARIVFIKSYDDLLVSRAAIIARNPQNKALKPRMLLRMQHVLEHSTTLSSAMAAFEEFECQLVYQIAEMGFEAFCGPDDDATAEDIIYSDNYNDD